MTDKASFFDILEKYSDEVLYFHVEPKDIDIFNKIVEAYDNTALVSTVDAKTGKIAVWVTEDTKGVFLKLVKKMPVSAIPWDEYTSYIEDKNDFLE